MPQTTLQSLDELQKKGELAMKRPELQEIALSATSPTQAEKRALSKGFGPRQAKSCWALASIKKHHGVESLETHITVTNVLRAWQTPITMGLRLALSKKGERQSFDSEHRSVMKEREKLPMMQQPLDASYWMSRSQEIGTPVGLLSACFRRLINHYGGKPVETSFTDISRSGRPDPASLTIDEVCALLRDEDPTALDATVTFIIRNFSKNDVNSAWEKRIQATNS